MTKGIIMQAGIFFNKQCYYREHTGIFPPVLYIKFTMRIGQDFLYTQYQGYGLHSYVQVSYNCHTMDVVEIRLVPDIKLLFEPRLEHPVAGYSAWTMLLILYQRVTQKMLCMYEGK